MQLQIDNLGKVSITIEQGYWNKDKDYDKLTIVEKEGIFGTFISRKPVPAGTVLTNREYWIPFSSLKENIILDYNSFKDTYDNTIKEHTASLKNIIIRLNELEENKELIEELINIANNAINESNSSLKEIKEIKTNIESIANSIPNNVVIDVKAVNNNNSDLLITHNNLKTKTVDTVFQEIPRLTALYDKLDSSSNSINTINNDITTIKMSISIINKNISDINSDVNANTNNITKLTSNINELNELTGNLKLEHVKNTSVSYIIDQRGDISDPDDMVKGNYYNHPTLGLIKIDNGAFTGNSKYDFLTWLKENTHAYVSKQTDTGLRLKQLDDTDRTKFADGTSSVVYISNESGEFDVWMKINSDIYIKTEPWTPLNASAPDPDYVLVTIALELPAGEDETKWEKFSQYNLYGVYKACRINNKLYSLSGKRPVNNISQTESKSQARARGNGFKIVDYKFNKLIAFLFYGYYSTLDSQTQLGYGTYNIVRRKNHYPKITGQTDYLAGVDTDSVTGNGAVKPDDDQIIAGEGSDIKSNNFWHLENIQGDISECLDDMTIMQAKRPSSVTSSDPTIYLSDYVSVYGYPIITKSGKDYQLTSELFEAMNENQRFITISDIRGNITRIIQHGDFTDSSNGYINKMCFGDHADIIAKEFDASANTGFCDTGGVISAGGVALRSSTAADPSGGVGCLYLARSADYTNSDTGSRLLYEGREETIHIIDDATESL